MNSAKFGVLLCEALEYFSHREIAERLGVDPRTLRRWERGDVVPKPLSQMALSQLLGDVRKASGGSFAFADLFAGIGGIRLGFEANGGRCVYTSEWNKFSQQTYRSNFPLDNHPISGDIRLVSPSALPDFDVLAAGFPCQPFSIAGVSKKNALGQEHGFACATQGTLFFDVARILREKRPKAFLLENVKNLKNHDKGNTFRVIHDVLTKELKYQVYYKVLDGQHFVPQHRERILIVGFDVDTDIGFSFDSLELPSKSNKKLKSILHSQDGSEHAEHPFTEGALALVAPKYTLTDHLWEYLQNYAAKHRAAGNGFGFGLVGPEDVARTLSARYYKDGSEILIRQGRRRNPRRLTPRECARLMGFPDWFQIPVSDTQAYRQFGNSVIVPLIQEVARIMAPHLAELQDRKPSFPVQLDLVAIPNTMR